MRNVHNTGRFGSYNDAVENMFVEMLKNQDMTLEQYKQATEKYYVDVRGRTAGAPSALGPRLLALATYY